jgi:dienelactone hydrolase
MRRLPPVLLVPCVLLVPYVSCLAAPLPGTQPLDDKDDLTTKMVAGIDKYLMRATDAALAGRPAAWKGTAPSPAEFEKSIEPLRQQLCKSLGLVDPRKPVADLELVGSAKSPALVAETASYKVFAVRWPVLDGVDGEGLWLEPKGKPVAQVAALPDADWTPEMFAGLAAGVPADFQYARRLAENGCRVIVPTLIDRRDEWSGSAKLNRWTNQPHREFIYRQAYEMGRHIIGYEIQKVLAAIDWFKTKDESLPVGVWGYGEGGLIALHAGQVDPRINHTIVGGYFHIPQPTWEQPIYRNVWAIHAIDGRPEGGGFFHPARPLLIHRAIAPEVKGPPPARQGRGGAAPGIIRGFTPPQFPVPGDAGAAQKEAQSDAQAEGRPEPERTYRRLMARVVPADKLAKPTGPKDLRTDFDPLVRQKRQFDQLVAFTQKVWRDSESARASRFAKVDFSSPEKYEKSIEPIRKFFDEEVIGKLPAPTLPPNPKTRELYDTPKWKGYEVTLDLYPDVFAYGILLLPKDLKEGEKRPVVVCQHGLEGRPQDVCNPKERTKYYNSFGAQLADLGYIVYAPQNPYFGQDKFRVLQRKANPLKLSLFSFIVRQHERTLDWLSTLPNVDDKKLAFYGLSYGGKTAMRVPAILPKYCLSICSGDFNEWIGKNVSVDYRGSYMWSGEYEMPEFDLGTTFNYAEMAYLIAPRPFMVERGHDDGVGIDEMVAYEFAKVRYHYAKLKLPERTEIEWFSGGHEIHGQGTFAFLKKHLGYPK